MIISHRFNYVDKRRKSRSLYSQTIPHQAPDLRYIVAQVSNGQPVSVVEMRADNDASLDDVDLRFVSSKQLTSETIDVMLSHIESQKAVGDLPNRDFAKQNNDLANSNPAGGAPQETEKG